MILFTSDTSNVIFKISDRLNFCLFVILSWALKFIEKSLKLFFIYDQVDFLIDN